MNIVTGKLTPDEGKVEWSKNVHAGYLDQHAVLKKGMTIREVLKSAFDSLLQKEIRMNEICDLLGTADDAQMAELMEELGTIQDELTLHDFYTIDAKVEEVARALGLLDLGLDRDVTPKFCWQNYCWRNQTFCFWMSQLIISMKNILHG